jgi:signal transduction histidine kinase
MVFYMQPSNEIEYIVFHITNKTGMAAILLIIVACIYSFHRGFKPALFLLAGQLLFLAGVILRGLFIGMNQHVFPPSVFEIGLMAEVIIISYGLMYRYNQYKKEKENLAFQLQKEKVNTTKEIQNTQEQEQKRIAADLHDELGGNLAALKMTLQSFNLPAEQAETLNHLIDTASDNARHIAHDLMPPEFENTTLEVLLDKLYQRINMEGAINFHFYYSGKNNQFNKQEDLVIYRIIMELTNNIIKHSNATEASIQLVYHENQLTLVIEDNGKGINGNSNSGIGLKNVRLRVNFLSGSTNIDSGKNGTTIMIQIPFKEIQ